MPCVRLLAHTPTHAPTPTWRVEVLPDVGCRLHADLADGHREVGVWQAKAVPGVFVAAQAKHGARVAHGAPPRVGCGHNVAARAWAATESDWRGARRGARRDHGWPCQHPSTAACHIHRRPRRPAHEITPPPWRHTHNAPDLTAHSCRSSASARLLAWLIIAALSAPTSTPAATQAASSAAAKYPNSSRPAYSRAP
jgi:hypothetical protein